MRKTVFVILTMALAPCSFAVDGVVLINQSTVMAAGGFPYHISQSGSYRLSGNLTVPDANTTAISINTNNVMLDLNGFSIIGPNVCVLGLLPIVCSTSGTGNGVETRTDNQSVTVANGSVRGMGNAGISLLGKSSFIEKVHADSNGASGIVCECTISNSTATNNGSNGFNLFGGGILTGNLAVSNGNNGFFAICPSTVVGNTAYFNGFSLSSNLSTVGQGCVVANNAMP